MRLPTFLVAAVLASVSGVAAAKTIGAAEAKKAFFNLDMYGVYEPDGAQWRECIDATGATQYWFRGALDTGRLTISDKGELCFSYQSSGYKNQSCYTAERKGQGWRFVNTIDPSVVFVATRALPTSACRGDAPSA
jgi:hypothetical protein